MNTMCLPHGDSVAGDNEGLVLQLVVPGGDSPEDIRAATGGDTWVILFFVAVSPFSPASLTFKAFALFFGGETSFFAFCSIFIERGSFDNPILILFIPNIQVTVF